MLINHGSPNRRMHWSGGILEGCNQQGKRHLERPANLRSARTFIANGGQENERFFGGHAGWFVAKTPLQIGQHLVRACEAGFEIGARPIDASVVEAFFSRQFDDLEPRLIRHPACSAWPAMDEATLRDLAADIKENGQHEPATITPDGELLDGRNRMTTYVIAGVDLKTAVYDGAPVAFSISKNKHRRHMDRLALAFTGAELARLMRRTNQQGEHFAALIRNGERILDQYLWGRNSQPFLGVSAVSERRKNPQPVAGQARFRTWRACFAFSRRLYRRRSSFAASPRWAVAETFRHPVPAEPRNARGPLAEGCPLFHFVEPLTAITTHMGISWGFSVAFPWRRQLAGRCVQPHRYPYVRRHRNRRHRRETSTGRRVVGRHRLAPAVSGHH